MPGTTDPNLRRAILLLSGAAFTSSVSARLCDPMLPILAQTFTATPAEVAHVVSGFAVTYGLLQVFFGPLGDSLGKYRLIALTTLLCTVGTFGAAISASLNYLVFARVLTGAAAAGIIPLAMAWIGDNVPYEERQPVLAKFIGGQIAGVIGGQFIGGLFADTIGWRWAFWFIGALYVLMGLLVLREYRRNPLARHVPSNGSKPSGLFGQIAILLSAPWARVILAIVFLEGMLVFGGMAFIPMYLNERFALKMSAAGALMGNFGLGGLIYIFFAKHLVRRLGERGLALFGSMLIAAAWAMLAWSTAWAWTIPACVLLGLGYYMVHNTLQTNATQMAPQVRGTAVSLFASSFFLGQALGVSIGGVVYERISAFALFATSGLLIVPLGWGFSWLLKKR